MLFAGSVFSLLLVGLAVDSFLAPVPEEDDEDEFDGGEAPEESEGDGDDDGSGRSSPLSSYLFSGEDPGEADQMAHGPAPVGFVSHNAVEGDIDRTPNENDAYQETHPTETAGEVRPETSIDRGEPDGGFIEVDNVTDLSSGEEVAYVETFDTETDALILEFDGALEDAPDISIDLEAEDDAAVVLANGVPVTLVEGATNMTTAHVRVVMSDENTDIEPSDTADDGTDHAGDETGGEDAPGGTDRVANFISDTEGGGGASSEMAGADDAAAKGHSAGAETQSDPEANLDPLSTAASLPEMEGVSMTELSSEATYEPTLSAELRDSGSREDSAFGDESDPELGLAEVGSAPLEPSLVPVTMGETNVDDGARSDVEVSAAGDPQDVSDPESDSENQTAATATSDAGLDPELSENAGLSPSDLGRAEDLQAVETDFEATSETTDSDAATGISDPDLLFGTEGDDTLSGEGGDVAFGGLVDNDIDLGADANDHLIGGQGTDIPDDGASGDNLDGGPDRDLLFDGEGDDVVSGGAADDVLHGGMDADALDGGAGDDVLDGTFGHHGEDNEGNTVLGGDGDETMLTGQGHVAQDGATEDPFAAGVYVEAAEIAGNVMDFNPFQDRIEVIFDPDLDPYPVLEVHDFPDGSGADIVLNGEVILSVTGAQGLDPNLIDLRAVA